MCCYLNEKFATAPDKLDKDATHHWHAWQHRCFFVVSIFVILILRINCSKLCAKDCYSKIFVLQQKDSLIKYIIHIINSRLELARRWDTVFQLIVKMGKAYLVHCFLRIDISIMIHWNFNIFPSFVMPFKCLTFFLIQSVIISNSLYKFQIFT